MALVSWLQDCKDGVYLLSNITFRNLTAVQHFYFDFSLCRWKSTQHASWLFHVNKLILPVKSQRSTSALRNASAVYTIQKIDLYIYLSIHFEIIALAYCSWPQVFLRNISTCFLFCVIYHLHRPKSNVDSNYEDLPLSHWRHRQRWRAKNMFLKSMFGIHKIKFFGYKWTRMREEKVPLRWMTNKQSQYPFRERHAKLAGCFRFISVSEYIKQAIVESCSFHYPARHWDRRMRLRIGVNIVPDGQRQIKTTS